METDSLDDELMDVICEKLYELHKSGKGVVIHCFNGLNRTGYIIINFLCRYFNFDLKTALNLFQTARGHELDNEILIEALANELE